MKNENKKRKINVFKSISKILTPYIVTTSITVLTVKAFGGGLPFYKDDIIKYKSYSVKGSSDGLVEVKESYTDDYNGSYDNKSKVTTYSTWMRFDDQYQRVVKKYSFKNIDDTSIYVAFLNCDNTFFDNTCSDVVVEVEVSNEKPDMYLNPIAEGELYYYDNKDTLVKKESNGRNLTIAFTELLISTLSGTIILKIIYDKDCKKEELEEEKVKRLRYEGDSND